MSEATPKPRRQQNGKSDNRPKGGKGGTSKSGGVTREQLTPAQRNALKEVRNVIKDQATDEQTVQMLVDHSNDSKTVIRHILENGPDDGWSDVSSSKSKKRHQTPDEMQAPRDDRRGGKGGAAGTGKANTVRSNDTRNTRPTPKAAQGTKLPTPAPHPPAPAPAPQASGGGKSWASLARGAEPAPVVVDTLPQPWGADPPLDTSGAPPLFESMMTQARERQTTTPQTSAPTASPLPVPSPKPAHHEVVEQAPLPPPPQEQPPQPSQLYESQVKTQSPSPIADVELCSNPNHQHHFIANLLSLWDERHLCDLRLIPTAENKTNDVCISVHSAVIAAASAEIKKILIGCLQSNGTLPPDLVVHVETNALEELVRYMYTGDLRIHDSSVSHIMHAAETLGVATATELCVQFLGRNITAANALNVSDIAIRFNRPDLKLAVEGYLLKNIQNLVLEADFLEQPLERVKELLASDDAAFTSEVDVFRACVRWVRHDIKNRAQLFPGLMADAVRLPLMTPEQLLDDVEGEELVRADRSAQELVFQIYRYQALPESRRDTMEIRGTIPRRIMLGGYY